METAELAVLEALADPRIAGAGRSLTATELQDELAALIPTAAWQDLERQGLVEHWGEQVQLVVDGSTMLEEARAGRELEWASGTVRQGDVLAAFARRCRGIDDVEVLDEETSRVSLRCGGDEGTLELRVGVLFCDRLADHGTVLLLAELADGVVGRFVADERLRSAVVVYDLARLEKVDAVRSSAFAAFDNFLLEEYGVEVVPADSFTKGLVDQGIITLETG